MRTLAIFSIAFASTILFAAPAITTLAQADCPPGPNGEIILCNPLGENTTLISLLKSIFKTMRNILFVVVPIFIVVGAFQMLFSAGNPENFKKGQKTILYSVIGLVVIIVASGIVAIVQSILTV
jgi:magnesium-transporting ATPase (P-type)